MGNFHSWHDFKKQRRIRSTIGPMIGFCLLIYFLYHIFQGERGFFSWVQIQQQVSEDEKLLKELQMQREILERKVNLLRPDNLDPDILDERCRQVLNYARSDEVVLLKE